MLNITFNEQQQQAIDIKDGAVSVIAAAGSGKTTLLLGRIEKLVRVHNIPEKEILAVTFTRNSAEDLIKRLALIDLHFVNVGTFHSICGQILHKEGIHINSSNMVQEWQIDNCFKAIDQKVDVKDVMSFISYQKNRMVGVDDEFEPKDSIYSEQELRVFYRAYEEMKEKYNLYDFDDYLLLCLEVLKNNPNKYTYEYILVDEHQDSNKVQNLLLKEWCQSGNLFVVGDFRQNIYSFRSSNNDYLMYMDRYWKNAKTLNISVNYRSPKNIVEKSNQFIKQYYSDYEHYVDAIAHNKQDGHIEVNSYYNRNIEAVEVVNKIEKLIEQGTDLKEIAVIYRNNKHADYVENELKSRGINYYIANDSSFFKRKEVAGILAFLRLIQDTEDDNAFETIFKLRVEPLKFFSNNIFNTIQNYANKNGVSLYQALQDINYSKGWQKNNANIFKYEIERLKQKLEENISVTDLIDDIVKTFKIKELILEKYSHQPEKEEKLENIEVLKSFVKENNLEQFITYAYSNGDRKRKKKENAVQLMTIHRSKGLEFDNVFVIGVEDGEFPNLREGARNDILEEARLFYVAVTRSKQNLWISEIGEGNKFIVEYNT